MHSPLAYRFLRRVVNPACGYAYYAYDFLHNNRRAEILLRLTAEVQPAFVWVSPGTNDIYLDAIRLAGGVVRIFDGKLFPDEISKADMILLDRYNIGSLSFKKAKEEELTVIGFDVSPAVISRMVKNLKSGVMLEGKESFIMLRRPEVSPRIYSIGRF